MSPRSLTLVGVVLAAAASLPAIEIGFPSGAREEVGGQANPVALEAADLDGDGDLDLVAGGGEEVAWWESSGDGVVWTEHVVDQGILSVTGVAAVDFDRDGDLDLLAAVSIESEIRLYENLGGAAAWTTHVVASGFTGVSGLAVGDVDGDGDPDVLATSFDGGQVRWWSNDGGLALSWTGHDIASGVAGARGAELADLDGDGDLDAAAVAFSDGTASWWENVGGDGASWTARTLLTGLSGPYDVTAGDIDADGDLDLALTTFFDDTVRWLENADGQGTSWSQHVVTTTLVRPRFVELADVDADGLLDAVTTGHVGNVVRVYFNGLAGQTWSPHTFDDAVSGPEEVVAADLDGDGDLDLAAGARYGNTVAWWPNETIHRSALYPDPRTVAVSFQEPWSVDLADFDGDGDLDAVAASSGADAVVWFENPGFGDRRDDVWGSEVVATGFDFAAAVRAADLDGDGDPDVVGAALYGDAVSWWENADGVGSLWIGHAIASAFDGAFAIDVADLDGDGDLDVVGAALLGDAVTWWENLGGGGVSWTAHAITTSLDGAVSVAVADLDGDGDPDIAAAGSQSDTFEWFENLDGAATSWARHQVAAGHDYAHAVMVGDLDGDGDPDLVGAAAWSDELLWWENTAGDASAWEEHVIDGSVDGVRGLDLADLDGDGDLDVLAAAAFTSDLGWWEDLDGAGVSWTRHAFAGVFVGGTAVRAGDLTGDGWPDVVATPLDDNAVVWWQSFGGQFALATEALAPAFAGAGATVPMLAVTAHHRGRVGDGDATMRTIQLMLAASTGGLPLTAAGANTLISQVTVWRDDGDGVFEPGVDTVLTTVGPLTLSNGQLQLELPVAGDAVSFGVGTPATFFVVAELAADAHLQTPHSVAVKHCTVEEYSSSAWHQDYGVGLELERVDDVWTGTLAIFDPSVIFADGFESGVTAAWSVSVP